MNILTYTGGLAETNAYFIESSEGWLIVDAPEGALNFAQKKNIRPTALVLTHGHWDHIWDAAKLVKEFECPVFYHQADEILCMQPEHMRSFGLPIRLDPVAATRFLVQGDTFSHGEWNFHIFHIPGHCPGSICLYEKEAGIVFGGDVLFAGGVGRWDLPGGSKEMLLTGITQQLLTLPDETIVYPGHGPSTTIGEERQTNPYVKLA